MLSRILRGSLVRRRRLKLLSLLAVTLGITVATTVGTIGLDVGDKVNRELRSFGANISVTAAADGIRATVGGVDLRPAGAGAYLPQDDLIKLKSIFWRNNIVAFAPFVYVPVEIKGRRAVLVGTWFQKQLQIDKSETFRTGLGLLHPNWIIRGEWPGDGGGSACLMGQRLASLLGAHPGENLVVERAPMPATADASREAVAGPHSMPIEVRGVLETGGPEDDQIFAPLEIVQAFAGLQGKVRRVEISALTKPQDAFARSDVTRLSPEAFERWYCTPYVSSIAYQIQQSIPGAEAKPVYRVAETEGKILNQVSLLMWILAAAALATAALAVASVMLANVLERRTEIGLYKSLGSTDARVAALFLLEAASVGLAGGVAGFFAGGLLAKRLGSTVFGASTSFQWIILPMAVALALVVTLAGSALPLGRGLRISPATVLRNE
jgi:putative ABC transport system permease protein